MHVKHHCGKITHLKVYFTTTVETLKEMLLDEEGIPPEYQRFIYAGQQLEGRRTLSYYNIKGESTLHVVLRLRAGMFHFTSGREDFSTLSPSIASRIQKTLAFQFKGTKDPNSRTISELQKFIVEARYLLTTLEKINNNDSPDFLKRRPFSPSTMDNTEDDDDDSEISMIA